MMFRSARFSPFRWQLGVTGKLYWLASLSTVAVIILVFASIHFARLTEFAAQLTQSGFDAVESSARLQSLLAQHRQIVESAPAEVDRARLEVSQREFIAKSSQLSTLLNRISEKNNIDSTASELQSHIATKVPSLIAAGQQVLFYAYNFAQDKALESAADYTKVADEVDDEVRQYRDHQIRAANSTVSTLANSARALFFWVSISAVAALLLIGPLGLSVTRGVLRRLDRITKYMTRLAAERVAEQVPSRGDHDELGDMARAIQVFKDNGEELQKREIQLAQINLQLDLALNNMAHGLCMFGPHRTLIVCNSRYATMYGLPDELTKPGTQRGAILQYLIDRKLFAETPEETWAAINVLGAGGNAQLTKTLSDGRTVIISYQRTADGGWVTIHEDITERRKAEAHIVHLARHDHLTNLPNRSFLHDELERSLGRLRDGRKFAILCLDLDRFKGVNDSLGHPVGDRLLNAVASRLGNCVKEHDFVARLGGDEFAIIQADVRWPEESGAMASRIIEKLSAPYEIDGHQLDISVSIGLVIAPSDGTNADQLLKNADLAMYRAKANGGGSYCFFESEMDARIQARRALELELRGALAGGQLQLYYQPLVNPRSGEVGCFEALLRWFHPRLGEIPPNQFVPLAEESGLIGSLGQWVLRSACAEAAKWPKRFRIAVNLSPAQFKNLDLIKIILSALATSGLSASRLELEITESLLLEDNARTITMLHELRSLGVRIVMDDFGTGYSSLNYLRSFPFDKIKIDKSFIHDLSKAGNSGAIIKAIIDLARALNIDVVAEGVETKEQLEHLVAEGCGEVQGNYFGTPNPIKCFEKVFGERNGRIELAA